MKYLIVIPLMLLLGCVEKQQNTQNVELFEEANKKEILFKGDTIKCYQDEKSTKYYLRYSKQSYLIPYFYMFLMYFLTHFVIFLLIPVALKSQLMKRFMANGRFNH